MSFVLNFATPNYQVLVGTLDVTPAVSGLGIAHNSAEIGEPLIWSGTLNLINPLPPYQLTESLDNLVNPGRWAKGAHPIQIYFWGELFLTLRILDYNYDPDTGEAEASLTDKLGLVRQSGGTKDKPLEGFAPSASINLQGVPSVSRLPWAPLAKAIASQGSTIRNATLVQPSQIILPDNPGSATYSNPPPLRGDAVAQLANIASASANLWVWCDKNENVRFVAYPRLGTSPLYRLSRQQVEDFKRLPPDPTDEVSTVEVVGESNGIDEEVDKEEKPVGSNDVAEPLNPAAADDPNEPETLPLEDGAGWKFLITPAVQYPIITESPPYRDLQKRHKEFQPIINEAGTIVVRKDQTEAKAESVVPETKLRGLIVSEENNTEESYDSKEGKLLKKRILKKEPLGKIASDIFPKETARITSEDITEEWEYDTLSGIPRQRVETIRRPACVVFKDKKLGTGRIPAQKTFEIWVKLWGDITGVKYRHETIVYKTKGELYPDKYPKDATLAIDPDGTQVEIIDYEPQIFYKETGTPLKIKVETKDKEFDNTGTDEEVDTAETEETITLTDVPDSNDALDEVAETAGSIKRQRIGAHDISHPCRKEDLLNFQPFQVVDVHTGRFVRDEFKIALGEDKELACLYVGNLMGVISPVPCQPQHILVRDGAEVDIPITTGATIATIKLQSGEGVPPYTYSADDLPDGLTLSGNEISGTPTVTGTTTATITVTDGNSNTYTQVLNFNSTAVPAAIAHYRQIQRFPILCAIPNIWRIVDSPRTTSFQVALGTAYSNIWQLVPSKFPISASPQGDWEAINIINAPVEAAYQTNWRVDPIYGYIRAAYNKNWVIESIAQFAKAAYQTNWRVDPIYGYILAGYPSLDWQNIISNSADGVEYSVIEGVSGERYWQTATPYTDLTDSDGGTGVFSSNAGFNEITVDFGSAVYVTNIEVGGGFIQGLADLELGYDGYIAYYLNGVEFQYSTNNSSWTTVLTISGVTDSGGDQFKSFAIDPPITARYWRLFRSAFESYDPVATTEFVFT